MSVFRSGTSRLVGLVLAFVFSVAACTPAPTSTISPTEPPAPLPTATAMPAPAPTEASAVISLTDGLGRTISLENPAARIVSMAPSNTEILFVLGAGKTLVGRDEFSDYPEEAVDVPSVGGGFGEYNMEAIVALQPDLVLAGGINTPEQVQAMEDLGLTVFLISNPLDFDGLYSNLEMVGTLTGHEGEADELVNSLHSRVGTITEKLAGAPSRRVFFEVDGTDPTAPWTTGAGTFQDYLIRMAGGVNVVTFDGWGQVNLEDLIASDPEVIFYSAAPYIPTSVESLEARPGWNVISAVRRNAVFAIDTDLTDLPGPRLVDGFEAFCRGLHPELFE